MQTVIKRKLRPFIYIVRPLSNDRKLKILLFEKMDGRNKSGRHHTEWTDNVVEWCGANLQELSHSETTDRRW